MTVPQVIAVGLLAFLNGFAIAVVLYRHYVMKPRWETESELRKELKTVRGDLYVAKHGRPVDHKLDAIRWAAQMTNGWMAQDPASWDAPAFRRPPSRHTVPHRAPSPVLKINSIDDLIQGTKP